MTRTLLLLPLLFLLHACAIGLPKINPVFEVPEGLPLAQDESWFQVEVPKGEIHKYEYRTATGSLIMDRLVCPRKVAGVEQWVSSYPIHYGITPGRFNLDGDPLDLLVLGGDEYYTKHAGKGGGPARKVRIIGTLKMEECGKIPCKGQKDWEQDWKVLAVDLEDPGPYAQVQDVNGIPADERKALDVFFSNYKGPVKVEGKEYAQTRVAGLLDKAQTLAWVAKNFAFQGTEQRAKEVADCQALFQSTYTAGEKGKYKHELDEKYLACVHRVHSPLHMPGSKSFHFFLRYSAYQRLMQLGHPSPRLEDALDQMENRKKARMQHYRYVERDLPHPPGTGALIGEWVLTKDRNKGCPVDFPAQHYEEKAVVPAELL